MEIWYVERETSMKKPGNMRIFPDFAKNRLMIYDPGMFHPQKKTMLCLAFFLQE